MRYVKVEFADGIVAYQEIDAWGVVERYLDVLGNLIFEQPPLNVGCVVIDADPPREPWMTVDP